MTSYILPTGKVSTSSEWDPSQYPAWKAMNRSNSTFWRSSSGDRLTCKLNYLFPLPQVVDKYTVTASTDTTCAPKDWKFQGYDGANWIDLDTQTGITFTSNEKKTYTFTNSTAYKEYRISVTSNNAGSYTEIAEMEMMATISSKARAVTLELQSEITATRVRTSNINLQTEVNIRKPRVASMSLQVEVIEGATSRLKKYINGEWVAHPLKRYENGNWVEYPLKAYVNGEWIG
jgi:hypothetical protein